MDSPFSPSDILKYIGYVVLRLSKKKEKMPLTVFAGKWKGGDIDRVFGKVMEDREKGKSRGAAF